MQIAFKCRKQNIGFYLLGTFDHPILSSENNKQLHHFAFHYQVFQCTKLINEKIHVKLDRESTVIITKTGFCLRLFDYVQYMPY